METRVFINILFAVFYVNIHAAPTLLTPWQNITNEITDVDVRKLFLNETRWEFLKNCAGSGNVYDEFLCPTYFAMVRNISKCETLLLPNRTDIINDIPNKDDMVAFCANFVKQISGNSSVETIDAQNKCSVLCGTAVLKGDSIKYSIKPLCKFISWGYNNTNCTRKEPQTVPVKAPSTSIPKRTVQDANSLEIATTSKHKSTVSGIVENIQNIPPKPVMHPSRGEKTAAKQSVNVSNVQKDIPEASVSMELPLPAQSKPSGITVATDFKIITTTPNATKKTTETIKSDKQKAAQNDKIYSMNNGENNDLDDQSKFDDESDIREYDTADSARDTIPAGKIAEDYTNLDPSQKKPDSPQDPFQPGEELMTQKTKIHAHFVEDTGSNFFSYFLFAMFLCIVLYVVYHNKSKILALVLEGRRTSNSRGGSRRKHTAAYRKLDTNLEEAITSSASGRSTQIIY